MVSKRRPNWKIAFLWVFGTILITFGAMIAGHLEQGLGVDENEFLFGLAIAFFAILLGGLLWIIAASAIAIEINKEKQAIHM